MKAKKTKHFTINTTDELGEIIEQYAESEKRTPASCLAIIIEDYFKSELNERKSPGVVIEYLD